MIRIRSVIPAASAVCCGCIHTAASGWHTKDGFQTVSSIPSLDRPFVPSDIGRSLDHSCHSHHGSFPSRLCLGHNDQSLPLLLLLLLLLLLVGSGLRLVLSVDKKSFRSLSQFSLSPLFSFLVLLSLSLLLARVASEFCCVRVTMTRVMANNRFPGPVYVKRSTEGLDSNHSFLCV